MSKRHIAKTNIFKILAMTLTLLVISTSSLAELNQTAKVYTQKGYPFEGLVKRSEQVTIIYTKGTDNVSCRVEVSHDGQIWQGEKRSTSLKKFTQKPLRSCMDRVEAKKLLAKTF
jgi:hypothetical protein